MQRLTPALFLAVAALVGLSGCATTTGKPLTRPAPHRSITVHEPFSWGDAIITKKFSFPKGDYLPLSEDSTGVFYVAPAKIEVYETFMHYQRDGGLYLANGRAMPDQAFIRTGIGPMKLPIGSRAKMTANAH